MGKIYKSGFTSINGIDYEVTIECDKGSGTTELKMSGEPFIVSMDSEDDHIYSPIKCSGATVEFLTEDLMLDIYSATATGTKVFLKEGDKTLWCGYLTPAAYSQPYGGYTNYIQLECRDAISALKDIKYLGNGEIKTFSQIIAYCIKQAALIKEIYITDNVQLNSVTGTDSVIEKLRISEVGLQDQKDDVKEPDENVAWSCYDVLYQILQFLGYTMVTEGDKVIILDYDAIKSGNNSYFKYTAGGDDLQNPVRTNLNYSLAINAGDYHSKEIQVDLTEVYNKITVSDDFNTLNDPEAATDGNLNITAESDPNFNETWIENKGIGNWYDTCDTIVEQDEFGNNLTYQICVHRMHAERWCYTVVKFYDDPNMKFFRYSKNSPYTKQERKTDGVGYVMNSRGGSFMKYCHIDMTDNSRWHASPLYTNRKNLNSMPMATRKREWVNLLNNELANLNYTDCILLMNGNQGTDGHIGISRVEDTYEYHRADITKVDQEAITEPYQNYPCVEYTDTDQAIFGNKNAYIILQGDVTTHDEWWNPWPMNNGTDNGKLKYDKKQKCVYGMFIWAKMQWGDMFWNGGNWVNRDCFFKLFWYNSITDKMGGRTKGTLIWEEHYVKRYFDKTLALLNTDRVDYVTGQSGYYVPAPQDGNLNGEFKLTFYLPRDIWDLKDKRCDRYYTCVQAITDFKVEKSINTGGSMGDDSMLDADTVYTNEIENGAISEMDEIEFKVCTYDFKNKSYSVVDYLNSSGKSVFLDTTYNKANNAGESGPLRQEEHLIYKLATQYEKPRVIYQPTISLEDNPKMYGLYSVNYGEMTGKKFITDTMNIDYRSGLVNIKLVEKI